MSAEYGVHRRLCEAMEKVSFPRRDRDEESQTHISRIIAVIPLRHIIALHRHMEIMTVGNSPPRLGNSIDGSNSLSKRVSDARLGVQAVATHLMSAKMPPLRHSIMREDLEATLTLR